MARLMEPFVPQMLATGMRSGNSKCTKTDESQRSTISKTIFGGPFKPLKSYENDKHILAFLRLN